MQVESATPACPDYCVILFLLQSKLLYSMIYSKEVIMAPISKAKVFYSGRSQAVRIPAEFRFKTDEVYVRRDLAGAAI